MQGLSLRRDKGLQALRATSPQPNAASQHENKHSNADFLFANQWQVH
jgi:hypothetical protein